MECPYIIHAAAVSGFEPIKYEWNNRGNFPFFVINSVEFAPSDKLWRAGKIKCLDSFINQFTFRNLWYVRAICPVEHVLAWLAVYE